MLEETLWVLVTLEALSSDVGSELFRMPLNREKLSASAERESSRGALLLLSSCGSGGSVTVVEGGGYYYEDGVWYYNGPNHGQLPLPKGRGLKGD